MSKPLFVLVSDSHLDPVTYQDNEELRYDTLVGFRQGRQLAEKMRLPLLSAGDTVECNLRNYPKPEIIRFLAIELIALGDKGLPFWYINGNHDRAIDGVSIPEAINPRVAKNIDKMSLDLGAGVNVLGMDYVFHHQLEDSLRYARDLAEQGTLLVCHQRWKQFLNFDNSYDGSLCDIPDEFEQVITGDLHSVKLVKVKSANRKNPLQVLSPGATCKRTSAEPDEHYVWIVGHNGTAFTFKRRLIKSRPVVYFELNTIDDVDSLMDTYKSLFNRCETKTKDHPLEIRKPLAFISGKMAAETFDAVRDKLGSLFFVRKRGRAARERPSDTDKTQTTFGQTKVDTKISVVEFVEDLTTVEEVKSLVDQGLRVANKEDFISSWEKGKGA